MKSAGGGEVTAGGAARTAAAAPLARVVLSTGRASLFAHSVPVYPHLAGPICLLIVNRYSRIQRGLIVCSWCTSVPAHGGAWYVLL